MVVESKEKDGGGRMAEAGSLAPNANRVKQRRRGVCFSKSDGRAPLSIKSKKLRANTNTKQ